jgi:hypothetical protein
MQARLAAIAAVTAVLLGGLFAAPASGAGNSTVAVTAVATSSTYPGSANATAVVTPDVSAPAGGTLTYSFFANSATCTGTATTQNVNLNPGGTVPDSNTQGSLGVGSDSFNALYNGDGTNDPSLVSTCESVTISQGTPTPPTISNLPAGGGIGGSFVASVQTNGDGTTSVVSNSTSVCTVGAAQTVSFIGAGTCSLTAQVSAGIDYLGANGTGQAFLVARATPTAPTISNLPAGGTFSGGFTAVLSNTNGDGTQSVASNTPTVCSTNGLAVTYVGVGTCSLSAQVAQGNNYLAGSGAAQRFTIGRAVPTTPTITNIPSPANEFFGFTAIVGTTGDGTTSVTSSTPNVCSVGTNGLTVTFVGFGACTLTPSVAQGANYFGATGSPRTFTVQEASHGYWLVGSDGGIFSFGSAAFHGSTGGTPLQRPVMAITPTSTGNGYWLVASDGGIFSFGDSTYYGSLPGLGFHPAGSGLPQSLNAPIVGMVPTFTGHGYFMVASDGGVFAFGDAKFEGSCPGIGGCAGRAVAVMPDSTGKGYWLVTDVGGVYAFGDASFYGAPPAGSVPVVGAVATTDGHGYWLLYANGVVSNFGDAVNYGAPVGYVNGFNPATTIFPTLDNKGYWVASARGDVFAYGDSPYLGSMAAAGLNGEIIGAFGF